jgi:hypothetical protein
MEGTGLLYKKVSKGALFEQQQPEFFGLVQLGVQQDLGSETFIFHLRRRIDFIF